MNLTQYEMNVLYQSGFQQGTYPAGSFVSKLIEAIMFADDLNQAKLALVFPEIVAAVQAYSYGDLVQRYKAGLKGEENA